jgi:hypothetical protein
MKNLGAQKVKPWGKPNSLQYLLWRRLRKKSVLQHISIYHHYYTMQHAASQSSDESSIHHGDVFYRNLFCSAVVSITVALCSVRVLRRTFYPWWRRLRQESVLQRFSIYHRHTMQRQSAQAKLPSIMETMETSSTEICFATLKYLSPSHYAPTECSGEPSIHYGDVFDRNLFSNALVSITVAPCSDREPRRTFHPSWPFYTPLILETSSTEICFAAHQYLSP